MAVCALHILVSEFVGTPDAGGHFQLLLGVSHFVFGLFAVFAIENARTRLIRVNELLKAGDADLISLHELSASFSERVQDEVRDLIDAHLQDQIDYRLVDFDRSTTSFTALFRWVRELEPQSPQQEVGYDHLIDVCIKAAERRKLLESLVRQRVSNVEWLTLLSLFTAMWGLMLASSNGPLVANVLGGVLVASLAGILLVLRHFDQLRWQEGDAIWQPLHSLALSVGLIPYYPRPVITTGRADPPTGPIRIVDYPHPYPDMSNKQVSVIYHVQRHRG